MPEYDINGVPVKFPGEPYVVQRAYMEKVIDSLNTNGNAILESPTGTGKTLSLLCATLGWLEKYSDAKFKELDDDLESESGAAYRFVKMKCVHVPKVIYASRTHSQISQAMKELKRTEYKYMKTAVIGSRNQLCIHPKLQKETNMDKIHLCKTYRKTNKCSYFPNVLDKLHEPDFQDTILDIEELGKIGVRHQCCPYYVSKELVKSARIIFMPYNYLIDPKIREANQINLEGAIIILDEAHNVEQMCEDSASTLIKSTEIVIALRDMKYIVKHLDNELAEEYNVNVAKVRKLKATLHQLATELSNTRNENNDTHPGSYMFRLLEKARITNGNYDDYIDLLGKLIQFLADRKGKYKRCPEGIGLKAISEFLQVAFSTSAQDLRDRVDRCYKVYIEDEPEKANKSMTRVINDDNSKQVNFWCFSSAFSMQHLMQQNIRCLILTSGTLAPLPPMISEMNISVPVRLENPHIIEDFQIFAKIVGVGANNRVLNCGYNNRDDPKYLLSLGQSIEEFARVVPDGLLVFFPSYGVMYTCKNFWQRNEIWTQIEARKPIFLETKVKEQFKDTMKQYYANINEGNGAIFMAVLRGKVSEGLDFADRYGRAVVIVGIPFLPCKEKKVVLKKQYLNENRSQENGMFSGNAWYTLDAIRAVNQAIGRVIRHKNDYGAILLCDTRFSYNTKDVSKWIKAHLNSQQFGSFAGMIGQLGEFFTQAAERLPIPEPRTEPEADISDDDMPSWQFLLDTPDSDNDISLIDEGSSSEDDDDDDFGDETENPAGSSIDVNVDASQVRLNRRKRKSNNNSPKTTDREVPPQHSTSEANEAESSIHLEGIHSTLKRTKSIPNGIDSNFQ